MANLFRQEVVAHRAAALFDGVVIRTGDLSTALSIAALLLAGAVIAVACTATYARKERVTGALVPDKGLITVVVPASGTVSHLAVGDGARVSRGQPLFAITSAADAAGGGNADATQVELLVAERATLTAQLDAQARIDAAEPGDLARSARHLETQQSLLAAQRGTAERRAALLQAEFDRLEQLAARGHVAANLMDLKLVEMLGARHAVLSLQRDEAAVDLERRELAAARAQLPARRDARVAEGHARLLALERAIAAAEVRWSRTVRAPAAGRVAALHLYAGSAANAGTPALTLIPDGSVLRAELWLPAHAAGFVAPGQAVRVRYDAYPYQKYGLQPAFVRSVGRTALVPDEQRGPVRLAVPAYRVVAELDSQSLPDRAGGGPLRAGLTLQADIIRDRRRVIEWLLAPVFAAAAR